MGKTKDIAKYENNKRMKKNSTYIQNIIIDCHANTLATISKRKSFVQIVAETNY
jgi:hypothetical protein